MNSMNVESKEDEDIVPNGGCMAQYVAVATPLCLVLQVGMFGVMVNILGKADSDIMGSLVGIVGLVIGVQVAAAWPWYRVVTSHPKDVNTVRDLYRFHFGLACYPAVLACLIMSVYWSSVVSLVLSTHPPDEPVISKVTEEIGTYFGPSEMALYICLTVFAVGTTILLSIMPIAHINIGMRLVDFVQSEARSAIRALQNGQAI